ncbi:uncharacterized protein LOC135487150 [Lineus longissimus]|uniref:uncharacterized protein LOC135487150 n=1 Tax=Lineus longissimus TaxID=88925 RepID=UPI00315CCEAF
MPALEILRYLQGFSWTQALPYLIILFISWLVYALIIKPLSHPLVRQLRGPRFVPILGNVREIIQNDTISNGVRWAKEYGHMLRYFFFFGTVRLMLFSPDAFKHILVTNSKNYGKNKYAMRLVRRFLGNGLVTSEGSVHTAHRKLANPAFGTSAIKKMLPKFSKKAVELCNFWDDQLRNCDNEECKMKFNISEDIMRATLDVIGECTMSYDFNSLRFPDHEISRAFRGAVSCLSIGFDIFLPKWHLWPTKRNRTINNYVKIIDGVVKTIIREKEEKFAAADKDEHDSLQKDLLAMMMSARDDGSGRGLSDEELKDHVITFVTAGHETTSHGLTWLFLHLAQNLEIQEKLREEVVANLPDDVNDISMETIEKMEYLNAVVKETLRLTPPVAMVFRETIEDDVICGHRVPAGTTCHLAIASLMRLSPPVPVVLRSCNSDDNICGQDVPAGTNIILHLGAMMRLPEYWDDPETFKPERFINNDNINPYSWVPFVLGNRMCIGYRFALLEMKVMIALLMKRFKFSWVPGFTYRTKLAITMRPDPPLELFVEPA